MKNTINNMSEAQYLKKYKKNDKLLKFSKKEVEDFDKKYGKYKFNDKEYNLKFSNYLLTDKKWTLINDHYYEIPKLFSLSWFRNLNVAVKVCGCVLLAGGISAAIATPLLLGKNEPEPVIPFSGEVSSVEWNEAISNSLGLSENSDYVAKIEDIQKTATINTKNNKSTIVDTWGAKGYDAIDEYGCLEYNNGSWNYISKDKSVLYVRLGFLFEIENKFDEFKFNNETKSYERKSEVNDIYITTIKFNDKKKIESATADDSYSTKFTFTYNNAKIEDTPELPKFIDLSYTGQTSVSEAHSIVSTDITLYRINMSSFTSYSKDTNKLSCYFTTSGTILYYTGNPKFYIDGVNVGCTYDSWGAGSPFKIKINDDSSITSNSKIVFSFSGESTESDLQFHADVLNP